MSEELVASIPPPSADKNNLAIADLVIYALLFVPAVYIAWKHGKAGMVCWPIFVSYFILRFVSDGYQIAHRHDPEIPNAAAIMTNAGSIACLSLTLIGLAYEVNETLPGPPKRWTEKIILAATHLTNTAGIGLATYGGSPSAKTGGAASPLLDKIGNCMMLFVMFALCWWLWQTGNRVMTMSTHPNFRYARHMHLAASAGVPFQLVRICQGVIYAFDRSPSLDPITGTFATRLILIFAMQLGVSVTAMVGGWLGMGASSKAELLVACVSSDN